MRIGKRNISLPLLVGIIVVTWIFYFEIGISGFSKSSAVAIFSSVIQGMSALLSVSIAVIIFRIQSLENRNQQLEESTLNFIYQTTRLAYPKWIPSVEEGIRNGNITERYYRSRIDALKATGQDQGWNEKVKEYHEDKDTQQKRLEETLNLHTATEQTIQRIRTGVLLSVTLLIFPILVSFYYLMVSDALDLLSNYLATSFVILMSVLGIVSLMVTVLASTVQDSGMS